MNLLKVFDKAVLQNPKLPEEYTPLFTPFSLVEFIGLTIKTDPIPADTSLSDKIKNAKDEEKHILVHEYWDKLRGKNIKNN